MFCFQNLHGSSHLDLSVVKCLRNIWKTPLKELILYFKYTKNELHQKHFKIFAKTISYVLRFVTILRTLILRNPLQLASTGCQNATRYSFVESFSIVNRNIVKSKVKFKINHA